MVKTNVKKHPRQTKSGRTTVNRHSRSVKTKEVRLTEQEQKELDRGAYWLKYDYDLSIGNLPDSKHAEMTQIYEDIKVMDRSTLIKRLNEEAYKTKRWENERAVYEYSQDDDSWFTTKKHYNSFLRTLPINNLRRELLLIEKTNLSFRGENKW